MCCAAAHARLWQLHGGLVGQPQLLSSQQCCIWQAAQQQQQQVLGYWLSVLKFRRVGAAFCKWGVSCCTLQQQQQQLLNTAAAFGERPP